MTPGSSRTQASSSASAAISPPESTKSPSETSSSSRASISRSSTPSKRAADDDRAEAARRARRRAPASAARRAGSSAGAGACRAARASSARASTSAFITMPGPPPAGVSSTVRCLSVAWSRMSMGVERPDVGAERLAGEARRQRPGKHLGKDREHARAPHAQSSYPASLARRSLDPCAAEFGARRSILLALATIRSPARRASVNGSISGAPPPCGAISRRSPAPKLCTAVTVPSAAPSAVTAASPTRSA